MTLAQLLSVHFILWLNKGVKVFLKCFLHLQRRKLYCCPLQIPKSSLRVVTTVAFGMGVDAPDVGQIIHYGPSDTMEAYVQ